MNGFELWIFGFGSNLSTNCATTTAQEQKVLVCREKKGKVWKGNDEKTVKGFTEKLLSKIVSVLDTKYLPWQNQTLFVHGNY